MYIISLWGQVLMYNEGNPAQHLKMDMCGFRAREDKTNE